MTSHIISTLSLRTKICRRYFSVVLVLCAVAAGLMPTLTSCDSEVRSLYCRFPAFFRFSPVSSAATPLYAALNNPETFCTIRMDVSHYYFALAGREPVSWPRSSVEVYGAPICITGFLVGIPRTPDFKGEFYQVAFDLACPKCYEEAYINRDVELDAANRSQAVCPKCHTIYDLDNGGNPRNAKSAPGLYRYACSYKPATDMFVIQNMTGY